MLNDVEVAIEVVEVVVVVETVVVEVNDVEMDVEVTPPTITMLVKPRHQLPGDQDRHVLVP